MNGILDSDVNEVVEGLGGEARQFSGKTVLICGGLGFLGRYFIRVFEKLNANLSRPCRVVVADNLITAGAAGQNWRASRHVKFIKHNIIKPLLYKGPLDYLIQAAGIASPYYYRAYPLETLEVATLGTKNCLTLARDRRARILFFSSSEIYGDPDPRHVPTPESYRGNVSCHGPRACYDESKRLGETLCGIFHTQFATDVVIVRPFNIFGPGMQETDYRVLPNFANRIKGDRPIRVYGSGHQTRTFCYISDGITGFLRALLLGKPGEAYNIGNPTPEVSMMGLVGHIEKALKRKFKYELIEYPDSYPADEPLRRCPDITKARLQLRYNPRIKFEDGLRRFFRWTQATYNGKAAP